jgi:hypothetical protein
MKKMTNQDLVELDELYAARDASGRQTAWSVLVARLREIRRAIEAGQAVEVHDGLKLASVLDFHTWAYGRYKLLEEGCDSWIGDDVS